MIPGRNVIIFIAMSLDGYIAGPDESLEFLTQVEEQGEDYGYAEFIETVDTVITGRRTYKKVLAMGNDVPYPGKDVYVYTRKARRPEARTRYYTGSLKDLVESLKRKQGEAIFVDGGAVVINELLQHDLIDEFYISIIPVLLGNGTSLFSDGRPDIKLRLIDSTAFPKGLIKLHYVRG